VVAGASALWEQEKSAGSNLSLLDRLDYQGGLRNQLPGPAIRVVYSASGMYLAAAVVEDPMAVVEHKLYWAAAESMDEALFLVTVLNSNSLLRLVQPLQPEVSTIRVTSISTFGRHRFRFSLLQIRSIEQSWKSATVLRTLLHASICQASRSRRYVAG